MKKGGCLHFVERLVMPCLPAYLRGLVEQRRKTVASVSSQTFPRRPVLFPGGVFCFFLLRYHTGMMFASRSATVTIVMTLALSTLVAMTVYIGYRFWQTGRGDVLPPEQVLPPQTITTDPGRAFIQVISAADEAQRATAYDVIIDSNDWSKCSVDVYNPDEVLQPMTKEKSQLVPMSPGRFAWTWGVPADAKSGTWLLRFLCGTYENLTTQDKSVTIQ
jgi:hypothetical protein